MNPQSADQGADQRAEQIAALLAQLHDVRAEPLALWPPAPGWWALALALLLVVLFGVRAWRRRRRRRWWVPLARTELEQLREAFERGQLPAGQVAERLSVLMRRAALAGRPRHEVARLTDDDWLRLLSEMAGGVGLPRRQAVDLVEAPYRDQGLDRERAAALIGACSVWMRRAARKC